MIGALGHPPRRPIGAAGALILAAALALALPVAAQDGGGFVAPAENPPEGTDGGGSTIQGGGVEAAVSFYASPRLMYANTSSVVRSGPGTEHPQVGTIPYGGQVTVLGDAASGSWVYLQLASGVRGFTASHLLSSNPPVASSSGGSETSGGSGGSVQTAPSTVICAPDEVVIRMEDGSSICARLQP